MRWFQTNNNIWINKLLFCLWFLWSSYVCKMFFFFFFFFFFCFLVFFCFFFFVVVFFFFFFVFICFKSPFPNNTLVHIQEGRSHFLVKRVKWLYRTAFSDLLHLYFAVCGRDAISSLCIRIDKLWPCFLVTMALIRLSKCADWSLSTLP